MVAVFVSLGDINLTRQMSFVFFPFVTKSLQNSFTTDAENDYHLLKDRHPPFLVFFP
jgi:hypothetical protein